MIDFNVINEQLPVIQFNFEELKSGLSETLNKYKGAIVTEDNLSGCKATQKELAGIKSKIDRYRIDKKKELSIPIAAFESQCKELVELIEKVEQPIKDGIKVFDDETREKKRSFAAGCIIAAVADLQLNEKYSKQLTVLDNYTNLTAKEKAVCEDIQSRAEVLKQQQDVELQMLEIIKDTIDNANKKIDAKMCLADFQRLINAGTSTKEIMAEINDRAERIKQFEIDVENLRIKKENDRIEAERIANLSKDPIVEPEPIVEKVVEPAPQIEVPAAPIAKAKLHAIEVRITGTAVQTKMVADFMRDNDITFKLLKHNEID